MKTNSALKQRGSETVEFALISPWVIFLALIFFELGVAFSEKSIILESSRVGARELASGNENWKEAVNAVLASSIPWGRDPYVCDAEACKQTVDGDQIIATIDFPFNFVLIPNFLLPEKLKEEARLVAQTSMPNLK